MKRIIATLVLITTFFLSCITTHAPTLHSVRTYEYRELLYDNIWGTLYNAEKSQCDDTPLITGDGSRINPYKASELRWIAISHEMLYDEWRRSLIDTTKDNRFAGKIQYGDTIWIESPYPQLNGWWIVRDTKNKRYQNSIDFLQTKGDGSLYGDDPLWCGKWEDIKIYKYNRKWADIHAKT